jgi:hypothetical protein
MIKYCRIFFIISLSLATGLIASCDSDTVDNGEKQMNILADVTFYSSMPYANETRGYWNGESYTQFYQNTKPPFYMMVITRNDEGKEAIKEVVNVEGTVIEQIYQRNDSIYILSSSLYFESPLFYVSNSYRTDEMQKDIYPIHILPKIIVKMKNDGDAAAIEEKYKDKLTYNPNNQKLLGVTIFDCHLGNSNEVLKLTEEIGKLEDVAWAEPDHSGGYFSY